ncbi:Flagellar basal body rod protein FlgB [Mycobacteroides abscessus subsp. abscessus]|nr:Flagellar basal body rod protein FlgB [Mycobacteroides abscessus subsp. abscessus]
MKLFSNTINTLENALNYSSTKQKVIAQNISNADTPGYKAKNVSFKSELNDAMSTVTGKQTNSKHIAIQRSGRAGVTITTDRNTSYNHTGNNVDIDKEMSDLATNQIYYNAMIERISGKFNSLQTVIKGGR